MAPLTQVEQTLSAEAFLAEENAGFLQAMGIITVHLQSSPGAGKTSLILRTVESLKGQLRLAVIQGVLSKHPRPDPFQTLDVPSIRVHTGGQAYIDASMLREALDRLPLVDIDMLLVEEIGSLTGLPTPPQEQLGVVVASLPEGEDCPLRYPEPFAHADAIVLNKLDLLPHLRFDRPHFRQAVQQLNQHAPIFELSCHTGKGLQAWWTWLLEQAQVIA